MYLKKRKDEQKGQEDRGWSSGRISSLAGILMKQCIKKTSPAQVIGAQGMSKDSTHSYYIAVRKENQ